ncbi:hypothetical protein, partial [Vibrio cholerae]|uniref:hypothetical protein n=1 Tax=Vibrio cholerae TaxID=666 RepID=UPI003967B6D4
VRDGSRVPFEGSGKPLFTGMFMIFPWDSAFQHYNFSAFDIVHSHLFRADLLCYRNRASIKKWITP